MALSWVVFVPGFPSSGVSTSRVRLPPTGTRTYGLEATFLFSLLLFCMVEDRSLSGDVFTRRCLSRVTPLSGDASPGRCLSWAMPLLGDASLRRRLSEAMTQAINLLTSLPWSLEGSHHVLTLTFGQRLGTGRYKRVQLHTSLSTEMTVFCDEKYHGVLCHN